MSAQGWGHKRKRPQDGVVTNFYGWIYNSVKQRGRKELESETTV